MGTYMKNLDSESLNFVILWNLQITLNPLESIIAVVITKLIVNSTHSNWSHLSRVGRKQENAIKKLASDPDDWKTGWQSIAPLQLALLVWRAIHACKKTSNTCKLSFFRNHISLAGVILHLFVTRSTMRKSLDGNSYILLPLSFAKSQNFFSRTMPNVSTFPSLLSS